MSEFCLFSSENGEKSVWGGGEVRGQLSWFRVIRYNRLLLRYLQEDARSVWWIDALSALIRPTYTSHFFSFFKGIFFSRTRESLNSVWYYLLELLKYSEVLHLDGNDGHGTLSCCNGLRMEHLVVLFRRRLDLRRFIFLLLFVFILCFHSSSLCFFFCFHLSSHSCVFFSFVLLFFLYFYLSFSFLFVFFSFRSSSFSGSLLFQELLVTLNMLNICTMDIYFPPLYNFWFARFLKESTLQTFAVYSLFGEFQKQVITMSESAWRDNEEDYEYGLGDDDSDEVTANQKPTVVLMGLKRFALFIVHWISRGFSYSLRLQCKSGK